MQYHAIFCSFLQYHAMQCNTMQFPAISYSSMQYHAIPCNTMQYHAMPCTNMQYHAVPCNTMQYHTIQCNTMQYHACLITADRAYHFPVGSLWPFFQMKGVVTSDHSKKILWIWSVLGRVQGRGLYFAQKLIFF